MHVKSYRVVVIRRDARRWSFTLQASGWHAAWRRAVEIFGDAALVIVKPEERETPPCAV